MQTLRMEVDSDGVEGELLKQDELLVKRLWCNLVEQGCQPVLLEDAFPVSSESLVPVPLEKKVPFPSYESEGSYGDSYMDVDVSEKGLIVSESSPPTSSCPTSFSTVPFPTSASTSTHSSTPLSTTPPAPCPLTTASRPAQVLSMPQLVAALILRHRERNAVRVRAGASSCTRLRSVGSAGLDGKDDNGVESGKVKRRKSPLSLSVGIATGATSSSSTSHIRDPSA